MRHIGLIFCIAYAAAAQTPDGVSINVTRLVNIPPDQADFVAIATVSLDTTQQQVAKALQDLGIADPRVTGVAVGSNTYSYPPPTDSLVFFQVAFTTAPSAMKDIAKKLDVFRANLPEGFAGLQYAAALTVSQAAVDSVHQTVLPELLAEARAKAQALSTAAGLKLGAITGISESSYGVGLPAGYYLAAQLGTVASVASTSSGSQYTFYALVKFAAQ